MNRVFYLSIVAALAGFIFGFDTVVISGADKKLQSLWGSSDFYHGAVVMAMALWGTVLGALAGSYPTNKFGSLFKSANIGFPKQSFPNINGEKKSFGINLFILSNDGLSIGFVWILSLYTPSLVHGYPVGLV